MMGHREQVPCFDMRQAIAARLQQGRVPGQGHGVACHIDDAGGLEGTYGLNRRLLCSCPRRIEHDARTWLDRVLGGELLQRLTGVGIDGARVAQAREIALQA